jgi:lipopolysaccharide export system protein LptA
VVTYKDIWASSNLADYQTKDQTVLLTGNARAKQGSNDLQSDKIMVSLKDNKISLLGGSTINIIEEGTNEPTDTN